MAGAALVLAGAGLTVTGVAEAVSVPGVSPNQTVVDGPQSADSTATATTGTPTGDPTDTGSPSDPATTPSDPGTGTATSGSGTPSASTPAGTASTPSGATSSAPAPGGSASAPGTPSTTTAPTAPGGAQTAVAAQPQPRQSLAETGTDQSVPWLLSGSATLIAGGALFRFGPRRTPRRTH